MYIIYINVDIIIDIMVCLIDFLLNVIAFYN